MPPPSLPSSVSILGAGYNNTSRFYQPGSIFINFDQSCVMTGHPIQQNNSIAQIKTNQFEKEKQELIKIKNQECLNKLNSQKNKYERQITSLRAALAEADSRCKSFASRVTGLEQQISRLIICQAENQLLKKEILNMKEQKQKENSNQDSITQRLLKICQKTQHNNKKQIQQNTQNIIHLSPIKQVVDQMKIQKQQFRSLQQRRQKMVDQLRKKHKQELQTLQRQKQLVQQRANELQQEAQKRQNDFYRLQQKLRQTQILLQDAQWRRSLREQELKSLQQSCDYWIASSRSIPKNSSVILNTSLSLRQRISQIGGLTQSKVFPFEGIQSSPICQEKSWNKEELQTRQWTATIVMTKDKTKQDLQDVIKEELNV